MAGRELGFPTQQATTALSMKEQLARKTLRNIRLQGHTYVDLREDGKRYIFFCTLCLAPCYSDTILSDHLRGNLHQEKFAAAKTTLLGPNPWPFNDGILFFHNSDEQNDNVNRSVTTGVGMLDSHSHGNENSGAIIIHPHASLNSGLPKEGFHSFEDHSGSGEGYSDYFGKTYDLVIPGVMAKDALCALGVRLMGYGQISARLSEKDRAVIGVKSIWCEWLGKTVEDDVKTMAAENEFAIVTFRYYYDLGKQGLLEEIKLLMSKEDSESHLSPRKRHRKSLSDPEDVSESLSNQCDSAGEDSLASSTANSRLLLEHYDDDLLNSKIISSKTVRRELRKKQRLAAERMCDICQHKMLPGKDVASLLNVKTGRLVCSSRNVHGAFHLFHTSCLINWILLCEAEMFANNPVEPNSGQRPKKRTRSKSNESGKQCAEGKICGKRSSTKKQEGKVLRQQIHSVFCSDCQGTGLGGGGDELERPTYDLVKTFEYKLKLSDAHKSWMKHPENLQNCSTGLLFPLEDDEKAKEKVSVMKLLRFYRADEDGWIATS